MAQTCSKCSRANPADAVYCYYDGFVLAGHSQNGGPVAVGSKPFAHPFVFPTGRHCRNFNELAQACVEDWDAARDLLRQGYLETFLGGLGRIDLEDQEPPDRVWCSRQHALITFESGLLTIEDLNSANGTYVNRNRIYPGTKRPLAVNDIIQIGNVQMKVLA